MNLLDTLAVIEFYGLGALVIVLFVIFIIRRTRKSKPSSRNPNINKAFKNLFIINIIGLVSLPISILVSNIFDEDGLFFIIILTPIIIGYIILIRKTFEASRLQESHSETSSPEENIEIKTETKTEEQPKDPDPVPPRRRVERSIFISYRRGETNDITGRIYDKLVKNFSSNQIFKDIDSIPLGVDFRDHLDRAVAECDVFLAVIGNDWIYEESSDEDNRLFNKSDFIRIETESALTRDIPVIPLLVKNATLPKEKDLPDSMKSLIYRQGIPIRTDPDFHNDMDRLIKAINDLFISQNK